jgi:hypothetical protein
MYQGPAFRASRSEAVANTCWRSLRFMPQTHWNALCDPQIPPDAKHMFDITCPDTFFVKSVQVPPELEK